VILDHRIALFAPPEGRLGIGAHGHLAIAELLIERRADINAATKDGQTPLKWAKEQDDTKIIELLRKHGARE